MSQNPKIDVKREKWLARAKVLEEIKKRVNVQRKAKLANLSFGLFSEDKATMLETAARFRILLQRVDPPINLVLDADVAIYKILEFLARDDYPQLQFEAAWVFTNIAAGDSEQINKLVEIGAIPYLVRLLSSADAEVRELGAWSLGNIAGDSPTCRDLVIGNNALIPLLALCGVHEELFIRRTASWALSNFSRGKPQPPIEQRKRTLPVLANLLHSEDEEVLMNACRALSHLSEGNKDEIQDVVNAGVCQRVVDLLFFPSLSVLVPALRTVANFISRGDYKSQVIIKAETLYCLLNLLRHDLGESIHKDACLILANITAGNCDHTQDAIKADNIFREAAMAFSNATCGATTEQIEFLVNQGCIQFLCDLLLNPDPEIVFACLQGLETILEKSGAKMSNYTILIEEAKGLDKIENLQAHESNKIYEKAVKILVTYWMADEDIKMSL